ncbi:MAG: Clp protease N-terminal domain-containing protein, partial [Aggregatilineales bacterium]
MKAITMNDVTLGDILISAKLESQRMRHYYLGLEHIFIAMLGIRGGLATSILADAGFAPEYVVDAIRRKAGKGGKRLWMGFPNTPRIDVILGIAHEIAREHDRQNILERDLLIAILEENESMPIRVLQSLGLDIDALREQAQTREIAHVTPRSFVRITLMADFEGDLSPDQLFILRRMFHGKAEVRVETRLTGGYTPATILIVTPVNINGNVDASVVVKIGSADIIQDEAYRYEQYVKNTLPPLTARLEERPIAPESSELAALKYTLVTDSDGNPRDMRSVLLEWSGEALGEWLTTRLYDYFGEFWWKQRNPFRFDVWQEYDRVLPPILTLDLISEDKIPADRKKV